MRHCRIAIRRCPVLPFATLPLRLVALGIAGLCSSGGVASRDRCDPLSGSGDRSGHLLCTSSLSRSRPFVTMPNDREAGHADRPRSGRGPALSRAAGRGTGAAGRGSARGGANSCHADRCAAELARQRRDRRRGGPPYYLFRDGKEHCSSFSILKYRFLVRKPVSSRTEGGSRSGPVGSGFAVSLWPTCSSGCRAKPVSTGHTPRGHAARLTKPAVEILGVPMMLGEPGLL